jgi:hypothetical protein
LDRQVAAVRDELPVAQLDPMTLDLDDGDAFSRVGEDDVDLVVPPIRRQGDVGEHQPVVAETVAQRLDHRPLFVVRQTSKREVLGDDETHGRHSAPRVSGSWPADRAPLEYGCTHGPGLLGVLDARSHRDGRVYDVGQRT